MFFDKICINLKTDNWEINNILYMKKKLISMLVLMLACVGAVAQVVLPADGNVYRFVSVATGKAMTNGDNKAHNVYLFEAEVDETSEGQKWCLVSLSNKEPLPGQTAAEGSGTGSAPACRREDPRCAGYGIHPSHRL